MFIKKISFYQTLNNPEVLFNFVCSYIHIGFHYNWFRLKMNTSINRNQIRYWNDFSNNGNRWRWGFLSNHSRQHQVSIWCICYFSYLYSIKLSSLKVEKKHFNFSSRINKNYLCWKKQWPWPMTYMWWILLS